MLANPFPEIQDGPVRLRHLSDGSLQILSVDGRTIYGYLSAAQLSQPKPVKKSWLPIYFAVFVTLLVSTTLLALMVIGSATVIKALF